ncbi:MAG: amidohydrolase, partial [Anaerolineales bacterium]|nr:amidohydrolase [Anaerolineales bacterium]
DDKGNPTGILLEGATSLVSRVIPAPSLPELMAALLKAQAKLLAMGITSVHDFDAQACFSALQKIHAESELKLRVVKSIPFEALPTAVSVGLRTGFGDDWLRIGNVKMFSDGALGPYTAAMLQPYENSPNNRGLLLMDAAQIYAEGRLAVDNGLALAIHAIGDRANHEVLNALARLRQQDTRLRHRIEHVQVLQPQDTHRLAELGVIASMQPIHTTSDMYMADAYWGKRAAYSYALKTQLEHGATLAFGSDAPVESPNPFWGIHAAVTRRRADGSPGPAGWYPNQRLPVHQAIAGFTTGAAIAASMEDRQGKLVSGYFADLLVLDTNPFECNPDEIRNILPAATMVAGEWMTSEL